jgi:hypothetical protein
MKSFTDTTAPTEDNFDGDLKPLFQIRRTDTWLPTETLIFMGTFRVLMTGQPAASR